MSLPESANRKYSLPTHEALVALAARQAGASRLAQPIAIVGPREASTAQVETAYRVSRAFAEAGMVIVCGGKNGVMDGAARGAHDAGGICVGLLPEEEATYGNQHLTVALPTGFGLSRNVLVARSAACLIAIGSGLGTTSEIAMALQWRKPVFATADAPMVAGAQRFNDDDTLVRDAACWLVEYTLPAGVVDLCG